MAYGENLSAKKGQSATNMERMIMPSKISKKDFQIRINELYPDEEIEILDYDGAAKAGQYRCLNCGKTFKIYKMGDLLRKKHCCNYCNYGMNSGKVTKQKQKEALTKLEENNLEFVRFGYIQKIYKPTIVFKCLRCGQTQEKQLSSFLEHSFCSYCVHSGKKMNTEGFKVNLPSQYTMLEDYNGTEKKILFRHEDCGFIWKTTPHNLVSGCGCPKCANRRSKGEKRIIDFLSSKKIEFVFEKSFEWSDKKRYDFYLPNYNLLIEYNGVQHYKNIIFHGERQLGKIKQNDLWKKGMALSHNFSYLEISYEDFSNIEAILAQRLSLNGSSESETESILTG